MNGIDRRLACITGCQQRRHGSGQRKRAPNLVYLLLENGGILAYGTVLLAARILDTAYGVSDIPINPAEK
jgi:hypothetical protein